jgi:putative phosphoesterase
MPALAVISDSHDNLATTQKALAWLNQQKIGLLIHCGDVCSPAMLKEISRWFHGQIHLVFGNVDPVKSGAELKKEITKNRFSGITSDRSHGASGDQNLLSNIIFHGEFGELTINDKKIAFCHKPEPAKTAAQTGKYDLVFYGHTHQPGEEKIDAGRGVCRLVNPGTLAGIFSKATFAIYDSEINKLELKLVEKLGP